MSCKYEFSEAENRVFSSLVLHARIFGLLVVIAGAFFLFFLALQSVYVYERSLSIYPLVAVQTLAALSCLHLAAYLIDGSSSFKKVVDTQGRDIEHLLDGLLRFGKLFRDGALLFWFLCVLAVVALIGSRYV